MARRGREGGHLCGEDAGLRSGAEESRLRSSNVEGLEPDALAAQNPEAGKESAKKVEAKPRHTEAA